MSDRNNANPFKNAELILLRVFLLNITPVMGCVIFEFRMHKIMF